MFRKIQIQMLLCIAVLLFAFSVKASAVTLLPQVNGGVMQQPTSNYYLECYGVSFDVQNKDAGFIVRASYIERPEFKANSFAEKDRAGLLLLGTTATKIFGGSLRAFFGAGNVSGYVARFDSDNKTILEKRSYQLPGPSASIEYQVVLARVTFAFNHTTFIGYGGKDQTEAMVAWPYNFYSLSTGISI